MAIVESLSDLDDTRRILLGRVGPFKALREVALFEVSSCILVVGSLAYRRILPNVIPLEHASSSKKSMQYCSCEMVQ